MALTTPAKKRLAVELMYFSLRFCITFAHEPGVSWDDDTEYDGADEPNDKFGNESSSDESTDSEEGFGG